MCVLALLIRDTELNWMWSNINTMQLSCKMTIKYNLTIKSRLLTLNWAYGCHWPSWIWHSCSFWHVGCVHLWLTDCLTTSAHSGGTPYSGFSLRNRHRSFRGGAKAPPTYRKDHRQCELNCTIFGKHMFVILFKDTLEHTFRAFLLLMIWTLSSPVRLWTSILLGFLQRCLFCLGRPSWKWNCICILFTPWIWNGKILTLKEHV